MTDLIRHRRTMPADVAAMLREARQSVGLLVSEAAYLAGIGRSHLSNIEAARRVPSAVVARALADVLVLPEDERARLLAVAVDDSGRSHPQRRTS